MNASPQSWMFHRPTFAEIDLRRVQSNFRALRSLVPEPTFICPMVKANAYGHGDIEVARALRQAGASALGVGLIEEGMSLRLSGDQGAILLFGLFEERSAEAVLEFELTPVVSRWSQLESLEKAAKKRGVSSVVFHLKFNTGMNRLGFVSQEASCLRKWVDAHPGFRLEGICTHLLRGDDAGAERGESESQLSLFADILESFRDLELHVHALNSSGTANLWSRALEKKSSSRGAVWPLGSRPGLSIYGLQPSNDEMASLPITPVLSLKSQMVMTHELQVGERVSYNARWKAQRPSTIGVVPMGYADGYFRFLSNKGSVLCRGLRAPIVGAVCMDYFMIDLTDVVSKTGPVGPGEEVVMIGEQTGPNGVQRVTAQELADLIGTIPYEILTNISERVPRVYVR